MFELRKAMSEPRWLSGSRKMALLALVLWCCSLPLNVFDMGMGGRENASGLLVLRTGWLGSLEPNFGWYANIFFFLSYFRLWAGKVPVVSSLLAVLLALDSIRFSYIPSSRQVVYGYGWGILLWFLAIFLLLAAVGKRCRELDEEKWNWCRWMFPAGLILCGLAICATLYFAVHDRMIASPIEAERLADIRQVAFKRLPACSASYPVATEPMRQLSGPVEIALAETEAEPGPIAPFNNLPDLLYWGIPAIRFRGVDYSYGPDGFIGAVPAIGPPAAILTAGKGYDQSMVVRLVEAKNNRLVFEQSWENFYSNQRDSGCSGSIVGKLPPKKFSLSKPCPEYDYCTSPGAGVQPRLLVMQALGLPDGPVGRKTAQGEQEETAKYKKIEPISYSGSIVAREEGLLDKRAYPLNNNCPADVGLRNEAYKVNGRNFVDSNFFQSGQKRWYWRNWPPKAVSCDENGVYFCHRSERRWCWRESDFPNSVSCESKMASVDRPSGSQVSGCLVEMEQRELENFQKIWAASVSIAQPEDESLKNCSLNLLSLAREGEALHLRLVDRNSGQIFTVRATPKKR